jgi:hypothetical protein
MGLPGPIRWADNAASSRRSFMIAPGGALLERSSRRGEAASEHETHGKADTSCGGFALSKSSVGTMAGMVAQGVRNALKLSGHLVRISAHLRHPRS